MTREEKLYTMTGTVLIQVADKLGVKVACNRTRTALKEAKAKVIARILEAEAVTAEEPATEIEEVETLEVPVTEEPVEVKSEEPVRKEKKAKIKKSYDDTAKLNMIKKVLAVAEENNVSVKTREKMPNYYKFIVNGKTVAEFVTSKNFYRINASAEMFEKFGRKYEVNKGYFIPQLVKNVDYADELILDIIKSLN